MNGAEAGVLCEIRGVLNSCVTGQVFLRGKQAAREGAYAAGGERGVGQAQLVADHEGEVEAFSEEIGMAGYGENFDGDVRVVEHVAREKRDEDGLSQIKRDTHADVS